MKMSPPVLSVVIAAILSWNITLVESNNSNWEPEPIMLDKDPVDFEQPPLPRDDIGDEHQAQLQILLIDEPITLDPRSPITEAEPEISYEYQCPSAEKVGCTALDYQTKAKSKDECQAVGNPCPSRRHREGEYCCVDACSRKYCTAKGIMKELKPALPVDVPVPSTSPGEDDLEQAQLDFFTTNSPTNYMTKPVKKPSRNQNKVMTVQSINDSATTTTGEPIAVNVLFNDFVVQGDGMPNFESPLKVIMIAANGIHGTCTIESESTIIYTPNAGHSGSDKCGYQACSKVSGRACDFATLTITIAKEADIEEVEIAVRPDDPGDSIPLIENQFPTSDYLETPFIDPDALLTPEVWEETIETLPGMEPIIAEDGDYVTWDQNHIDETSVIVEDTSSIVTETINTPHNSSTESADNWNEVDFVTACKDTEVMITFELQTDKYGEEVTWELIREHNESEANHTTPLQISRGPYDEHSFVQVNLCGPSPGLYRFNIYDSFGDGLGKGKGYYKIFLDGTEIIHVTHYADGNSHLINLGYDPTPTMTQREHQYLHAHNKRRQYWHEHYNTTYVPLYYSRRLAEESERWAIELLKECDSDGIEHEPGVPEGENLAKNKGLVKEDGSGWGMLYPVDKIVGRWVDREVGWAYPANAHLTQALWRGSRYLGCGESEKDFNGFICRVQVCRYARAGNCDMKRYNAVVGTNWTIPMLKDTSPCEPSCPPEGCYSPYV
mmetsp:Transcript_28763/g.60720  ORF Transcript_28763/g.60720 Transcript_28763/m.60720 type:complete len:724 (-) Transcript_28763:109-2280(-)